MDKCIKWFPQHHNTAIKEGDGGMTLRDYFAAQCLTMQVSFSGDKGHAEAVAKQAYKYADAMLKARGE